MKTLFSFFLLGLLVSVTAKADWTKSVQCDDGLRIDMSSTSSTQYQVVVTNHDAIQRFLSVSHLSSLVNTKGELISPIRLTDTGTHGSRFESGYTRVSENGYVEAVGVSSNASNEFTLSLLGGGPTGPENVEVWKFRSCHN